MSEMRTKLGSVGRDEQMLIYGGMGLVGVIVVLILIFSIIFALYLGKKGAFKMAYGIFDKTKRTKKTRPEHEKHSIFKEKRLGGLREIDDRAGESIGSQYKR